MMDPSKKHSFEDQWKEAFEKASVTPPASAWDAIEARLGHLDAEQVFGDQWKKAFDDASVIPPPALWGQIEARLEEEENIKIIPLWWQSPKLWLAAASVAALLLVGLGWWYNDLAGNQKQSVATSPLKNDAEKADQKSSDKAIAADQKTEEPKAVDQQTIPDAAENAVSATRPAALARTGRAKKPVLPHNEETQSIAKIGSKSTDGRAIDRNNESLSTIETGTKKEVREPAESLVNNARPAIARTEEKEATGEINAIGNGNQLTSPAVRTEMLASIPYKDLDVYVQKRYVFFNNDLNMEVPAAIKHKEYWAGIGLMPSSFNPNVNVKTSPSSFANQSFAKQKSVIGKNDPGVSYALQTQGGMRISKHWSVETGVSYLQGNANYEGGGYLLDAATNGFSNVLETALADASAYTGKSSMPSVLPLTNNSIYIDVTKKVRNDYRYLQLPVQAGFTLNPDGKLSYSVLGGMLANVFLNNELESANGNVIKTTAADEVYRGLNWAATTGLRFNYKLSSKWRASLTGSYQKAVTSGFRSNQSLESHPFLYGVSWGMRYSF